MSYLEFSVKVDDYNIVVRQEYEGMEKPLHGDIPRVRTTVWFPVDDENLIPVEFRFGKRVKFLGNNLDDSWGEYDVKRKMRRRSTVPFVKDSVLNGAKAGFDSVMESIDILRKQKDLRHHTDAFYKSKFNEYLYDTHIIINGRHEFENVEIKFELEEQK